MNQEDAARADPSSTKGEHGRGDAMRPRPQGAIRVSESSHDLVGRGILDTPQLPTQRSADPRVSHVVRREVIASPKQVPQLCCAHLSHPRHARDGGVRVLAIPVPTRVHDEE